MKKMKKALTAILAAATTVSLLGGTLTASADDGERTKITALLKGTESTEQFMVFDYLLSNFCEEK